MMTGKSETQQQPSTLIAQLWQMQFLAQELDVPGITAEIERVLAQKDDSEDEAAYIEQLTDCLQSSCAALLQQTAVVESSAPHLDNHTQKTLHTAQSLAHTLQQMLLREIHNIDAQTARLAKWPQWESELQEAAKGAVWKLFSQTEWPLLALPLASHHPFIEKLNRQVAQTVKQTVEQQAIQIQIEIQQELAHTLNHLFAFATTYDQLLQYINSQLLALELKGPLGIIWPHYDPHQRQRRDQITLEMLYTFEHETAAGSSGILAWRDYDSEKLQKRLKGALNVLQTGELDDSADENIPASPTGQLSAPTSEIDDVISYATPVVSRLGHRWRKYHHESANYAETQTIIETETALAAGALGNTLELNALYSRLLYLEPGFDPGTAKPLQRQYQTAVLDAIANFLKQKQTQIQQQLKDHIQQQFDLLKNELDQVVDSLQEYLKNFNQEQLGYDPVRLQQIRSQIEQMQ